MSPVASRSALVRSVATRTVARRQMSTAPKLHTSKDKWAEFVSKRPPMDHLDEHKVFHPPYNGLAVGLGLLTAFCAGYGSMGFGMAHQQYKQGYWK